MASMNLDASALLGNILRGIQALEEASRDIKKAPRRVEELAELVEEIGTAQAAARRRHQSKLHHPELQRSLLSLGNLQTLHHPELQRSLLSLGNLQTNLESELAKIRGKLRVKGIRRYFSWFWYGIVGDKVSKVALSMKSQLQDWTERHGVSDGIDEIIDRQAGRLTSFRVQPLDRAYKPIQAKVTTVLELLRDSNCKAILVHGLSGIGKSSLASHIAAICPSESFADGAVKIVLGSGCRLRANNTSSSDYQSILTSKFRLLLYRLKPNENDLFAEQSELNLQQVCYELERTLRGKQYLIFLDDVWEADIVARLLAFSGNKCKYIVTSRSRSLLEDEDVHKVELKKEDVQEVGKSILLYHSGLCQLPAEAEELAKCCGYHPLTLAVMGRALHHEGRSSEWRKAVADLHIYAAQEYVPSNYLRDKEVEETSDIATVFGSFDVSLKVMEKYAVQLFNFFAVLSWEEPVPEECLAQLWRSLGQKTTFGLQIRRLTSASLVRCQSLGKRFDWSGESCNWYDMHDMVVLYLHDTLTERASEMASAVLNDNLVAAALAPWLFRYGSKVVKDRAEEILREGLTTQNETFFDLVMPSIQGVCDACLLYTADVNPRSMGTYFNQIVASALLTSLQLQRCRKEKPAIEAAVTYLGRHFTPVEWTKYKQRLMYGGTMEAVAWVLKEGSTAARDAEMEAVEWIVHFLVEGLKDCDKQGVSALLNAVSKQATRAGEARIRETFIRELSTALRALQTPDPKMDRDGNAYRATFVKGGAHVDSPWFRDDPHFRPLSSDPPPPSSTDLVPSNVRAYGAIANLAPRLMKRIRGHRSPSNVPPNRHFTTPTSLFSQCIQEEDDHEVDRFRAHQGSRYF